MTEERKMGFMWGLLAGASGLYGLMINPIILIATVLAIAGLLYFGLETHRG